MWVINCPFRRRQHIYCSNLFNYHNLLFLVFLFIMELRLKEIRLMKKLTQREVADMLGVSSVAYSRYENGTREPSIDILLKLSSIYNISVDYLIGNKLVERTALSEYELRLIIASREVPQYIRDDFLAFLIMKRSSD